MLRQFSAFGYDPAAPAQPSYAAVRGLKIQTNLLQWRVVLTLSGTFRSNPGWTIPSADESNSHQQASIRCGAFRGVSPSEFTYQAFYVVGFVQLLKGTALPT